jgi:hypothetical protein
MATVNVSKNDSAFILLRQDIAQVRGSLRLLHESQQQHIRNLRPAKYVLRSGVAVLIFSVGF